METVLPTSLARQHGHVCIRIHIIRYVMLSFCMVLTKVSFVVKKRFPDLQHLVDAGLLREDELKVSVFKN